MPITIRRLLTVAPMIAGGDPLFLNGGAPLSAVHARALAGEPIFSIAADYDVPADDIEEALHAIWPRRGHRNRIRLTHPDGVVVIPAAALGP